MASVFLFHGAYGRPDENWFPWMQSHLEREGSNVFVPRFPTPEGQGLSAWLNVLDLFREHITPETIFVGHSIGGAFALRALESRDIRVKGVVLVAGFVSQLHHPYFDALNASFLEAPWDWTRVRSRADRFVSFASRNDPYVAPEKTDELRDVLESDIITIADAGHFNAAAGFGPFPQLLAAIDDIAGGR
jgi:predicted alpha/beta hydrolase family esterase